MAVAATRERTAHSAGEPAIPATAVRELGLAGHHLHPEPLDGTVPGRELRDPAPSCQGALRIPGRPGLRQLPAWLPSAGIAIPARTARRLTDGGCPVRVTRQPRCRSRQQQSASERSPGPQAGG
jgi:hypothetical protein